MADNKTPLHIDLVKNSNQKSDYYGHYYGRVVRVATLSTRAFAQHIADHNSIYGLDVVLGVIRKFSQCLVELVGEGKGVKLDGIGIFYPTAKNVKEGAATIADAKDMGADQLISGVHVRFLPDSAELDNITSKEMKKRCQLQLRSVVDITKTGSGKNVKYSHSYTPIEEASDPTPPTP